MRILWILLCVCTYGFLTPTSVSSQIAGPSASSPIPLALFEYNRSFDEWARRFIDHKVSFHVENTGSEDACNLSLTSVTYIGLMNIQYPEERLIGERFDDFRRDETPFYHQSDPACLVVYSTPSGVELKWRFDFRELEMGVEALSSATPHLAYRIHRSGGGAPAFWYRTFAGSERCGFPP